MQRVPLEGEEEEDEEEDVEEEEEEHGAFEARSKVVLVPRWQICAKCTDEFDAGTPRRHGECMYHPGTLVLSLSVSGYSGPLHADATQSLVLKQATWRSTRRCLSTGMRIATGPWTRTKIGRSFLRTSPGRAARATGGASAACRTRMSRSKPRIAANGRDIGDDRTGEYRGICSTMYRDVISNLKGERSSCMSEPNERSREQVREAMHTYS